MKSLLNPSLLVLAVALSVFSQTAKAQVQVQVNIGAPAWGPPVGRGVQYYYIPEIDGYYDLYARSYVFFDPYYNDWVSSPTLPAYYAGYDPYYFHPVVVQYVGHQPWGLIYDHRAYCNTRGWRPGYYRSAPGPRWQGGGYANGYRQPDRYDNRGYARNDDYRANSGNQPGRYQSQRNDHGPGRPDYNQPGPGRSQNGPSNGNGHAGGGRNRR
ncbi:hypothetical protein F0P96_14065 [Hymenobacter busanensis]|uniref:Uncharacterized protein n=1 Tax=Hymenobacter busanensis TaxID=2607656 RepID=A0A7L4ZZ22_9BACT|nr:hypothetical protein [Hymenobacter busanensis]KAA9331368.1 hypothetical protein F0P96_14065 [Hymenobacter busanensis]QHJ08521.1 hypothetical protein GUY19_14990 [Hymenobacter busanensis]